MLFLLCSICYSVLLWPL